LIYYYARNQGEERGDFFLLLDRGTQLWTPSLLWASERGQRKVINAVIRLLIENQPIHSLRVKGVTKSNLPTNWVRVAMSNAQCICQGVGN